jgi:hypothetical protein
LFSKVASSFLLQATATLFAGMMNTKLNNPTSQYGSGDWRSVTAMKYMAARRPIDNDSGTSFSLADDLMCLRQLYAQNGAKNALQNGEMLVSVLAFIWTQFL